MGKCVSRHLFSSCGGIWSVVMLWRQILTTRIKISSRFQLIVKFQQHLGLVIIFIRKWYCNSKVINANFFHKKNDKADVESVNENLEVDTLSISPQVQVPALA